MFFEQGGKVKFLQDLTSQIVVPKAFIEDSQIHTPIFVGGQDWKTNLDNGFQLSLGRVSFTKKGIS